jgi:lipopolysaccharide biosynthesis glycosyltransferase
MNPIVVALASNERYFPGLYCAVASALDHMATGRSVDFWVLDGGISQSSRNVLSRLANSFGKSVQLHFVPVDDSIFHGTTLGPGKSYMAYCRILLPRLLEVSPLIYLDCDLLVFRDLSELFDHQLSPGKILAAARDSETLSLSEDSETVAAAMKLPAQGAYFNSGVMLMNLDELRKQNFVQCSVDFLQTWSGRYRFHDQSAINFLLHDQIDELPGYWNRASWQFDEQDNNNLACVLHYSSSAPWLREIPGPAHTLFDQFARQAGLAVNRVSAEFKHSQYQWFWRNALAPLRAAVFFVLSALYELFGARKKAADYKRAGRYWFDYVCNARSRRRVHRRRIAEIQNMKFDAAATMKMRP